MRKRTAARGAMNNEDGGADGGGPERGSEHRARERYCSGYCSGTIATLALVITDPVTGIYFTKGTSRASPVETVKPVKQTKPIDTAAQKTTKANCGRITSRVRITNEAVCLRNQPNARNNHLFFNKKGRSSEAVDEGDGNTHSQSRFRDSFIYTRPAERLTDSSPCGALNRLCTNSISQKCRLVPVKNEDGEGVKRPLNPSEAGATQTAEQLIDVKPEDQQTIKFAEVKTALSKVKTRRSLETSRCSLPRSRNEEVALASRSQMTLVFPLTKPSFPQQDPAWIPCLPSDPHAPTLTHSNGHDTPMGISAVKDDRDIVITDDEDIGSTPTISERKRKREDEMAGSRSLIPTEVPSLKRLKEEDGDVLSPPPLPPLPPPPEGETTINLGLDAKPERLRLACEGFVKTREKGPSCL
ncbi:Uu.00g050320.m01.CDS01 [Anthostomella pinea]|uniref:Uu.00g050320.m01.CDS01 n=1 Tax=Anthostomella pinea TaxID=933095 RepID=A0AAI8VT99_9PEZI|nr:Uu.00g050320.m01.CDS01 [Anthostomella pinea]